MQKLRVLKILTILVIFPNMQLFSSNILQKKFNALVDKLLGGYARFKFPLNEEPQEDISDYCVIDLNIVNTVGDLAFIVNEKNISRIISEKDKVRVDELRILCTKFNNGLKKIEKTSKAVTLASWFKPYIYPKKDVKNELSNKKKQTREQMEKYISRINATREIKLKIIEDNKQLKISWDPKTNDLLYSKVLILTTFYTLFESLKPLIAKEKKLSAIHKKWKTIEAIRNINHSDDILIAQAELEKTVQDFSKKIANDLDTTQQRGIKIKDFLLNTFIALIPQILFGAVQSSVYSSIINIIKANIPNALQDLVKDFLKKEVSLFSNTAQDDVFTTFVYKNDEIEEKLVDIFTFMLSNDVKTIILTTTQDKIQNLNVKINEYLRYCLLPYNQKKSIAIKSFDTEEKSKKFIAKEPVVVSDANQDPSGKIEIDDDKPSPERYGENFYNIKQRLEMLPGIKLQEKDGVIEVGTTDVYKKQSDVTNLLGSFDQKTRDAFSEQIKEILGNKQSSEDIVKDLEKIKSEVKMVVGDTKKKNTLISEAENLISQIEFDTEEDKLSYKTSINAIQQKRFITLDERKDVIDDLVIFNEAMSAMKLMNTLPKNTKVEFQKTINEILTNKEKNQEIKMLEINNLKKSRNATDDYVKKKNTLISEAENLISQIEFDTEEDKLSYENAINDIQQKRFITLDERKNVIDGLSLKQEEMSAMKLMNTLPKNTKAEFQKTINEILTNQKISSEKKLLQLGYLKEEIKAVSYNTTQKETLIRDIQNLITDGKNIFTSDDLKRFNQIKEKPFLTVQERDTVLIELEILKNNLQKIKSQANVVMVDDNTKKREKLISEIEELQNQSSGMSLDSKARKNYIREFNKIKKKSFVTQQEKTQVLIELENVKSNLQNILPEKLKPQPKPQSRTATLKSWFGWKQ